MPTDPQVPPTPAQPGPVHRLTFEYQGDQIRLVSDQVVTMIAPASHPLDDAGSRGGFSVVVRDAGGSALYHRMGHSPIRHDAEVFGGGGGALSRVAVAQPSGTFVLLVPAVEGGTSVELVGHAPAPEAQQTAPRTLATFALAPPTGQA